MSLALSSVELDVQLERVEQTQHQAELGRRLASLQFADPLTGYTCASCDLLLAETRTQATTADGGREIVDRVDKHNTKSLLSAYADKHNMSAYDYRPVLVSVR